VRTVTVTVKETMCLILRNMRKCTRTNVRVNMRRDTRTLGPCSAANVKSSGEPRLR